MANSLLTISMITKESLRVLTGNLKFANNVNRGFNDEFNIKGAKIGQTVNIRKPARYIGRTGPVVSIENQTETYVPLTLDQQYGVDLAFTSAEQTMSLDLYSDRVIKPAMAQIANRIDGYVAALTSKVYNAVGTPGTALTGGTTGTSITAVLQAGAKLDRYLTPRDGTRAFLMDPGFQATLASNGLNLFNPSANISAQYKTGQLTEALGFGMYMDQNMPSQTGSTYAGTPKVNTGGQSGSTLVTDGWASGATTLTAGTVFTISGVKAVNPQTKAAYDFDQQFVVLSDVSDTTGAISISISPAIVGPGSAFQNVSALPLNDADITVLGATGVNSQTSVAFHPDAFVCGWSELDVPGGVDMASRATDPDTGVSVRIVRQYDVVTDRWITRFDTLFGANTLYEQLACKVYTT